MPCEIHDRSIVEGCRAAGPCSGFLVIVFVLSTDLAGGNYCPGTQQQVYED